MTMRVLIMLSVCALANITQAARPYIEGAEALSQTNTLSGKTISVHGLIDKLEKDGLSSSTFLIKLDGGIKCRISRDPFKDRKTSSGKAQSRFEFKTSKMNDLVIEYQSIKILNQGTDMIIRGTLKKEMNQWIVDKAIIRGCGESETRSALNIRCGGPCTRSDFYYSECGICRGISK